MAKTSGKKKRADLLLYEQGGAVSQDLAARLIMSGQVFVVPEMEADADEPSDLVPDFAMNSSAGPAARSDMSQVAGAGRQQVKCVTASILRRVEKPGDLLPACARLEYRDKHPYVSRGAYKLLTALEHFRIDVAGLVALDAGASTGGFTDCLLRRGAVRVYAVDVGKNQLHEKLRADSRVISLEGVNLRLHAQNFLASSCQSCAVAGVNPYPPARKLLPESVDLADLEQYSELPIPQSLLPESVDLAVADVSFISLKEILPACLACLKPGGRIIALIKPQFEVGSAQTVKGVVRDEKLREQAVADVLAFAADGLGLALQGVVPAAIKGPKGNQEYLAVWSLE